MQAVSHSHTSNNRSSCRCFVNEARQSWPYNLSLRWHTPMCMFICIMNVHLCIRLPLLCFCVVFDLVQDGSVPSAPLCRESGCGTLAPSACSSPLADVFLPGLNLGDWLVVFQLFSPHTRMPKDIMVKYQPHLLDGSRCPALMVSELQWGPPGFGSRARPARPTPLSKNMLWRRRCVYTHRSRWPLWYLLIGLNVSRNAAMDYETTGSHLSCIRTRTLDFLVSCGKNCIWYW